MQDIVKLMRPYQWVKNSFCFAGVLFGLHFFEINLLISSVMAAVSFCLMASAVYVFNDIVDVRTDRLHPIKCKRPLASERVQPSSARILLVLLVISALICSSFDGYKLVVIIAIYLVMNIYYSLLGKHVVILDVFIITLGFVLRTMAGTNAIGIPLSEWLTLCVIMLTLFLGFAKRRAELLALGQIKDSSLILRRRVLEHYEPKMLDIFIAVTSCATIVSYSLFVVINSVHPKLIYTILFVIYGVFRYIFLLYKQENGQDTARDLMADWHLIINVLLWIITYMGIIYYA